MKQMPKRIEVCGKWISEEYQKGWNACVDAIPETIPVEWLHKELVDQMYDNKMSSDAMKVFHEIIAKWRDHENS